MTGHSMKVEPSFRDERLTRCALSAIQHALREAAPPLVMRGDTALRLLRITPPREREAWRVGRGPPESTVC